MKLGNVIIKMLNGVIYIFGGSSMGPVILDGLYYTCKKIIDHDVNTFSDLLLQRHFNFLLVVFQCVGLALSVVFIIQGFFKIINACFDLYRLRKSKNAPTKENNDTSDDLDGFKEI